MSPVLQRLQTALSQAEAFAARYPRALTGAVVTALSGLRSRFGIAPLAPDASSLPKQQVVEQLPSLDVEDQLNELAAHDLALTCAGRPAAATRRTVCCAAHGRLRPRFAAFLRKDPLARRIPKVAPARWSILTADASGRVERLVARFPAERSEQLGTHFTRLTVERVGQGFRSSLATAPLQAQVRFGSGSIRTSLFAATDDANIPDAIASQMADMFSGDIDFHRELRKGDRFGRLRVHDGRW